MTSPMYTPTSAEYQVQCMTEEFEVWKTLETYEEQEAADSHAEEYTENNPDIEVQVVQVRSLNY